MRSTRARARTPRRGVVLVAVIALLALGAALVAGAFAAARGAMRATRSVRAELVAHAAARRAVARTLASWSASDDSLPLGGFLLRAWRDSAAAAADAADLRVRVHRLSAALYLVAVEASVPSARAPAARRRMRVALERTAPIDTTRVTAPRPLARWASAELY